MKKGLVHVALCALALAAPATAEKLYVPVLGPTAGGNAEKVDLIAIDADSSADTGAWLAETGDKALPAFTEEDAFQAGTDVPLGDLPRPQAMAALSVGAANLSSETASCRATLYNPNGRPLAEIPFEVAPLSLTRQDALAKAGRGRVASVHVTCDQTFYPVGVATDNNLGVVIAKGIGPNGPCNLSLTLFKQPTGHYTTATNPGIFHSATRANPKGILCIMAPQELRIAKAVFQWDITVGPWSSKNRSGLHNLAYVFLDRYRSGVVGNVNAAGPNKSFLKVMQNVGMPRGTNTNNKSSYTLLQNQTYHFVYTYDAANKSATLQTYLGGVEVNRFNLEARPGGQTLPVRPYTTGKAGGLAMVAEFGNYNNQHDPEMPTWEWKYSNFKLDMIPK